MSKYKTLLCAAFLLPASLWAQQTSWNPQEQTAIIEEIKTSCNCQVDGFNLVDVTTTFKQSFGAEGKDKGNDILLSAYQGLKLHEWAPNTDSSFWAKKLKDYPSANPKWDSIFRQPTIALLRKETEQQKLAQILICQSIEKIHTYYLQHPEELQAAPAQLAYYQSLTKLEQAPAKAEKPKAKAAQAEASTGLPYGWISGGLAVGFLLGLFIGAAVRPGNKKEEKNNNGLASPEEQLQSKNKQLQKEVAAAQQQLQDSEKNIQRYKQEIERLKDDLITQNREKRPLQEHKIEQSPIHQKPKMKAYLNAPPDPKDGLFYGQDISQTASPTSLFLLEYVDEQSQEANFSLRLEPAVLARVNTDHRNYLRASADIYQDGQIPPQAKITPGLLVRQGQGWRVKKKMIINW
ncbi:hypothetical protein SapgrDRAFT_0397 [Saprospira grandis DSM 2844]|uniref:Uncharacterized protein n=1 Tax=Saprospira grandis DSM 2844 TaxID=694433 RepID=J1I1M3_9BACT|nr:hypothetical protein [Saprospira grandis]EJF52143.1 hypothetical protein SapgrDRAFT_0397 [Saprospira grandis DSM 2844]